MSSVSVLHVTQPTTYGVAHYVAALARRQRECGWDVSVACPPDGSLPADLREAGVPHHAWRATRSPGSGTLGELRSLQRTIDHVQPHVVHLHSSKAGLAGRLAVRGTRPTIFQPHAWSFFAGPPPLRRAALQWERRAARWSDRIICGSEGELRSGRDAGVRGEMICVPNAVDADRFSPAGDHERLEARRRLGLPRGPLAVCVGRLSEQKGQDMLLGAWPSVLEAVPEAHLVLVGDGPERTRLEQIAASNVVFAGASDDVPAWLAAADVVVQPSRYETLSLSMLEAMARSRAVVATDIQGAREAVSGEPSSAGAVVPLGDTHALAVAVAERLADPVLAEREGQAGRRAVEQRYCFPVWFREMEAVTLEVVRRCGRDRLP